MTPMTAARWPSTGSCSTGWSCETSKARRCSVSCSRVEHTRVSMRWVRLCCGDQCQRFFTTTGRGTSAVEPGGSGEVDGVPSPTRVASWARTSLSVAAPTTDAGGWATVPSRWSRWCVSAAIQSSPEPTTTAYPPSRLALRTPATKAAGSPEGRGTTWVRETAREAPTRPAPGREDPTPTRQPARRSARAAVTAPRSRVCARMSTEVAGLPAVDMRRPYAPAALIRGRIAAAARGGISPSPFREPARSSGRRGPGRLEPMNENTGPAPASDLPPILPQPRPQQEREDRSSALDGVYAALRRLPARRTDDAVLGGVCATVADRLGVAPIAVRAAAVLVALLGGVGVGIYLIAWTLLPDRTGRTHLEGGLRDGRGRSLVVLALGALAALGVLGGGLSFLAAILPELVGVVALAAVGYWVWTRAQGRRPREDAAR